MFALVGIVLKAILMFLNLTVSVGTINGLLFSMPIVKLNEVFFSNGSVQWCAHTSQFISWLNLDLGIEERLLTGWQLEDLATVCFPYLLISPHDWYSIITL